MLRRTLLSASLNQLHWICPDSDYLLVPAKCCFCLSKLAVYMYKYHTFICFKRSYEYIMVIYDAPVCYFVQIVIVSPMIRAEIVEPKLSIVISTIQFENAMILIE